MNRTRRRVARRRAVWRQLSEHARLNTIASSQDSTLPQALVAQRFTGRVAVNELFDFEVDALSTSTDLDLADFIGEELTITLLQPDGTRRVWHGLCIDAAWLGPDGGLVRDRLHLPSAMPCSRIDRKDIKKELKTTLINVEGGNMI